MRFAVKAGATSTVVGAMALAALGCGGGNTPPVPTRTSASAAPDVVTLAKQRFRQAKARGVEMNPGPCLGIIAPGWVADVAHDPRRPADDLPQNQCAAYRSGRAHHFVELDPEGNLIRKQ